MRKAGYPPKDLVTKYLDYCPESGKLTWKIAQKRNQIPVGSEAGSITSTGYINVGIEGYRKQAHVLIYLIMTGDWPPSSLDHINVIRSDNRWLNLRLASASQQICNTKKRSDNSSGVKGIYLDNRRGTWNAEVKYKDRRLTKTGFSSIEEAKEAMQEMRSQLHGEFSNHGW